jgi:hypothetical protein
MPPALRAKGAAGALSPRYRLACPRVSRANHRRARGVESGRATGDGGPLASEGRSRGAEAARATLLTALPPTERRRARGPQTAIGRGDARRPRRGTKPAVGAEGVARTDRPVITSPGRRAWSEPLPRPLLSNAGVAAPRCSRLGDERAELGVYPSCFCEGAYRTVAVTERNRQQRSCSHRLIPGQAGLQRVRCGADACAVDELVADRGRGTGSVAC